ncbi:MAG TPA: RNA-directed DNA polymerase [Actinomycetota bacterium]|nr:RNA-directed DNA polymerase [Actinomycetota bacterium]
MALLEQRDARRWDALGGRIAAHVERRLNGCVVANRAIRRHGGWSLEPVGPALRRARRLAAGILSRSPAVLLTDVASFYPSVRPQLLDRALRAVTVDPADAGEAADLLEAWGSHGYPGLPIGPRASAVMANAVLRPVDRAIGSLPFVRWVDDYLIGLPDAGLAPAVVERIDEALDEVGLTRSIPKTRIGRRTVGWLGGISLGAACEGRSSRSSS